MELNTLRVGFAFYCLFTAFCISAAFSSEKANAGKRAVFVLFLGVFFHGVSLFLRWGRLEHGPYVGLYEGLSSGLWVSAVFYLLGGIKKPSFRKSGITAGATMIVWLAWISSLSAEDTRFPVTYDTLWFIVHVVSGKLSYGALFPAFVLSLHQLAGSLFMAKAQNRAAFRHLEKEVYPFMFFAFITATVMMVSGGIWAQKAWGREWTWDSLELGALAIWLIYGLYIHLRITYNALFKKIWFVYLIAAYLLTFYNLFGIPFLSSVIHSGMI
ncbi:MAG: cytochrome c biogenesis protein [Nitrospinota bacterium]